MLTGDSTVLTRIQCGDQNAFNELYLATYDSLIAFACTYVRTSPHSAEDIVQEVFLAIWRNREKWNPGESVRAYLFAAVRNRALKYVRHERVVDTAQVSGYTTDSLSLPPTPQEILETRDTIARLRAVVAALPERHATALKLRWDDDFTYPEIASVLGISPQAARTLLLRIQERLKQALG